jgi:diguanylate cyclase (GGDEF)-like protein
VPDHYVPTIAVVIVLDTIEAAISCRTFTGVFDNLVDSLIIAAFCIGTNIIFSKHQYAEFDRKEELKFESSRDLLTQLYNRRHIERYYALNAETDRACAMMMLDLDNFKMANDIYGHKKGDEVLCRVADILRGSFRDSDCVARLGGDEFAVFLPGISVNATVERVRSVLESFPITIEGACRVDVSVSIGIAYKEAGEEIDYKTLCDKADEAMYRAKLLGKGKAVVGAEKNTKEVIIVA